MHIIRSDTLGRRLASSKSLSKSLAEILGETFRARQASPQSIGSDYMHDSPQDSLRDSFFYADSEPKSGIVIFDFQKLKMVVFKCHILCFICIIITLDETCHAFALFGTCGAHVTPHFSLCSLFSSGTKTTLI